MLTKSFLIRILAWLDRSEDDDARPEVDAERLAHPERKFDHVSNYKEEDTKHVLDYLRGRGEVHVSDLIELSGADKVRVYPLLFELEQSGEIKVIKRGGYGNPEIVMFGRPEILGHKLR